jgi:hypothetical protein
MIHNRTNRVVLYKDTFPLHKSLSFSSFIYKLDQVNFSPYTLGIDLTDSLNEYELEFSYFPIPLLDKPIFVELKSLDYINLRYSEDIREVFLEASISKGWLWFYLFLCSGLFILFLWAAVISRELLAVAMTPIWLTPLWSLYRRGIRRCRRIRLIATNPA